MCLRIKQIFKALVCTFFVFAITVTNLPHFPIFSASTANTQTVQKEKIDNNNLPACKLFVDLKDGYFFSDYSKSCCKSFDTSLIDKGLVSEPESYLSKELKDLTLVETLFALGILMIGVLDLFEPIHYSSIESLSQKLFFNPDIPVVGKIPSYFGCGNGKIEDIEECDDGNLFNNDSCSIDCKRTALAQSIGTGSNSTDFKFSDPYTGLEFTSSDINNITKSKLRNKRIKLEQAVGTCLFDSLCKDENNFEKNTENIRTDILGSNLDDCLNKNIKLLAGANIGERNSQCSLNIDFTNGSYTGNLNQNCCSSFSIGDQELRTDYGPIEKHIRNIALVFVLFALSIFSLLALTYLLDTRVESKMVAGSRDSKLALYAADAEIQEILVRLNTDMSKKVDSIQDANEFFTLEDILDNKENNNDLNDFHFTQDAVRIGKTERRLEKVKSRLGDFLNTCTEQILCSVQNKIYDKNGKIDKRVLPVVANLCLKRVGILVIGKNDAPCTCTYKGCLCKPDAVCRSGKCSDEVSCKCSEEDECLCPVNKVCKKVQCDDTGCICLDSLCNADSDCVSVEHCIIQNSLNQTFSGVSGSIGSSSSGSTSSSGGTFSGVSGSISSSSSSGTCKELQCPSPLVFNSSTCTCECPKCPIGTMANLTTCSCDRFKGVCLSPSSCKNGESCDDGNVCTTGDKCTHGKCTGIEKKCDDGNSCTDDACNIATGECISSKNSDCNECTRDEDCNLSMGECDNGKCTASCGDGSAPCVVFPVSCLNIKCPEGLACKNGQCVR